MNKKTFSINSLVIMAIMVALSIVATRLLSITTPTLRIGFGFVPIVVAAMYLGPLRAGIIGLVADLVGFAIAPSGTFFPGFTFSAFLGGFIYGIFFEGEKAFNILNIILGVVVTTFIVDAILNTLWITLMAGNFTFNFFKVKLLARLVPQLIMMVIKIVVTVLISQTLFKRIRLRNVENFTLKNSN